MAFTKQDIYKALETITEPGEGKSLIENKNISNLVVFGSEVVVDVSISNPALQAKKKITHETCAQLAVTRQRIYTNTLPKSSETFEGRQIIWYHFAS